MYELCVTTRISAAHQLRGYNGVCETLHGHNWRVDVILGTRVLNEIAIGMDFVEIKAMADAILGRLDHQNINEIKPFHEINPSSENIARWLYDELRQRLSRGPVEVRGVTIWETDDFRVTYTGED